METQAIINELLTMLKQPPTTETSLLLHKLTRQLYSTLGAPTAHDFPEPFTKCSRYERTTPYTTPRMLAPTQMYQRPPEYHINKPSDAKRAIIDRYYKDGWNVTVQAYNVLCSRTLPHPRYDNLAVHFVSTRDKATYEYIITDDNND